MRMDPPTVFIYAPLSACTVARLRVGKAETEYEQFVYQSEREIARLRESLEEIDQEIADDTLFAPFGTAGSPPAPPPEYRRRAPPKPCPGAPMRAESRAPPRPCPHEFCLPQD